MRDEVSIAPNWEEPLALYVQHMRARRLSDGTIGLRSYQIRHLSRNFLDKSPWKVSGRDLKDVLAAETTWGRTAARSAVNGWRGFFKWAVRDKAVPLRENPCDELGTIGTSIGRPRPAPMVSIDHAIAAADERTRLMIYLGAEAGLRRSEIAAVHRRDLFRDSLGWMLTVNGKGNKIREVPLSPRLSALLLKYPDGWIFPSHHRGMDMGGPADAHIGADRVGKLISRVLGEGCTPHMLRHRFASDAYVTSNHDIRAVQELLGHSSVATTQVYTEVPRNAQRFAVDALSMLRAQQRIELEGEG